MVGCRSFVDRAQDPCSGQARVDRRFQCVVSQPSQSLGRKPPSSPHRRASSGVEDWEDRGRVEGFGAGTFGCTLVSRGCFEEGLKRCVQPPIAEANAKVARLEGSLAVLGPDDVEERRVLATVAPVGQRLDECEKYCERVVKRLEKAQEVVTEALKAQTLREEELAEGKRPLAVLRAKTDELTHLRRQVAQMEGELRQSHRAISEKSLVESTLKQQVEQLMQEVAALRDRVPPVVGTEVQETGLVTAIPRSGSARMEETEKKRHRITDVGCIFYVVSKWCKAVFARYGHRGVRLGEARNPGPPRSHQGSRHSFAANRFEILSSDDDEPLIPSTVPASSRAIRNIAQPVQEEIPVTLLDTLEFDLTQHDDSEEHRAMTDPNSSDVESLNDTADGMSEVDATVEAMVDPIEVEEFDDRIPNVRISHAIREALFSLDGRNLRDVFRRRATVMKVPPKMFRGAYCAALRFAMNEVRTGCRESNVEKQARGWKLFLLIPRLLLHRPARGGLIPRGKLRERFEMFAQGRWVEL